VFLSLSRREVTWCDAAPILIEIGIRETRLRFHIVSPESGRDTRRERERERERERREP